MQTRLLKPLLLLLVCFMYITLPAAAQKGRFNSKMRKELSAYRQENILPVLREQRIKLDNEIAAADKREIEQLRVKRHQIQEEQKALRGK